MLAGGYTIDFADKVAVKTDLQGVADAAALAAAREISLANSEPGQIQKVAENHAYENARAGSLQSAAGELSIKAVINDSFTGVTVHVARRWRSNFGKLFGGEYSQASASASAAVVGNTKICVLGLMSYGILAAVHLDNSARLTAADCGVYSNSTSEYSIRADSSSEMAAHLICAAGGTLAGRSVNFTPEPLTDCPKIPDPLAGRMPPPIGGCAESGLLVETETILAPGVYCDGLTITGNASVTLQEGTYVIKDGPLIVDGEASLYGDYVSFYMSGEASVFSFAETTQIDLGAAKDGPLAGLLFYEEFEPTTVKAESERTSFFSAFGDLRELKTMRTHRIKSNNARRLLGTIYLPNSILQIDANAPVADESAYTAIVVRRLWLLEGPHLVLNANYAATDVPVPSSIAGGDVRLTE